MPGMKADCGGAAAILGAFRAAVKQVRIVGRSQLHFQWVYPLSFTSHYLKQPSLGGECALSHAIAYCVLHLAAFWQIFE